MIKIELVYKGDRIYRIRVNGHAEDGRLKARVCTGVAVLSRTLADIAYVRGYGSVLSYGIFDIKVRRAFHRDAVTIVSGYQMLRELSPTNIRIVRKRVKCL